ncbi:hypothetical protein ASF29_10965 [Rhizobium sp. Leaf262]|nr:hypothetical protein ASF29_10965 [Rhizobium sp. Leaf262]
MRTALVLNTALRHGQHVRCHQTVFTQKSQTTLVYKLHHKVTASILLVKVTISLICNHWLHTIKKFYFSKTKIAPLSFSDQGATSMDKDNLVGVVFKAS